MANPFGYGELSGFSRSSLGEAGLFPSIWLEEALSLAMPSVYFPQITPSITKLESESAQNVVVPLDGNMNDTTWPTLTEGTSITVGSYNLDSITVTLKEAGRGLAMERLVGQYLSQGINPGNAQNYVRKLAHNFAMSWENSLRGIYMRSEFGIRSVAQGSYTGPISDIGGTGGAVDGTIDSAGVELALSELRSVKTGTLGTFVVPPFEDGLYRLVGNWKTLRYMSGEADFVSLQTRNQGLAGRGMIYQEIGPWNGFMFVRHDLMEDGTCLAMGRNVAVQAFGGQFDDDDIPGEDLMRLEDPVPFQVRLERDWQGDFYRSKAAAWYAVAGSSAALRDIGTHCLRIHVAT